jgi:hypothetical protein
MKIKRKDVFLEYEMSKFDDYYSQLKEELLGKERIKTKSKRRIKNG